jgi:hypothetical protein
LPTTPDRQPGAGEEGHVRAKSRRGADKAPGPGSRAFAPACARFGAAAVSGVATCAFLKHEVGVNWHHVALSIVGTDRTPDNGYFRAKVAQEKLIEASGIPYTIIRSTQFLEFLGGIAAESTDENIVTLSPGLFQPIAADDVAAIVADMAVAAPRNGIVEIAGPERAPFNEIVAHYLKAEQLGPARPQGRRCQSSPRARVRVCLGVGRPPAPFPCVNRRLPPPFAGGWARFAVAQAVQRRDPGLETTHIWRMSVISSSAPSSRSSQQH